MGVTNAEIMIEVKGIREDVLEIKKQITEANGRQRKDHDDITMLKSRMGQWATAQALWTAAVGVVAGWFGSQR